jgi:hypothetical protein
MIGWFISVTLICSELDCILDTSAKKFNLTLHFDIQSKQRLHPISNHADRVTYEIDLIHNGTLKIFFLKLFFANPSIHASGPIEARFPSIIRDGLTSTNFRIDPNPLAGTAKVFVICDILFNQLGFSCFIWTVYSQG